MMKLDDMIERPLSKMNHEELLSLLQSTRESRARGGAKRKDRAAESIYDRLSKMAKKMGLSPEELLKMAMEGDSNG